MVRVHSNWFVSTMQKQQILTYLQASHQSFEEGLQLYLRHGKNETLKKIFQLSGATTYNHQKLNEALQQEIGKWKPNGAARTEDGSEGAIGAKAQRKGYAVEPNHPELIRLYKERAMLKSQLTLLPNDEARKKQAFAILDLTDQIESILFHGFAPKKAFVLPQGELELLKLLQNNRKYISKYQHREEKAAEVARRRQENEEIARKIEK